MALIKNFDEQSIEKPVEKKMLKPKTKTVGKTKNKAGGSKGGIIVLTIIFLLIIGGVFLYNNKRLSDLQKANLSEELKAQIESVKRENQELTNKIETLKKTNEENKGVMVDLFDKSRRLPKNVDSNGWLTYNNEKLSFSLKLPLHWEVVKIVDNTPEIEVTRPATISANVTSAKTNTKKPSTPTTPPAPLVQQTIYLQPKNDDHFALAMIFKNDYLEFSNLTIPQKYDIFKNLTILDTRDFSLGKMVYYIDLDKNNNEIPTILILTDKAIYKAAFMIQDKTLENYMKYRIDFENIVATFGPVQNPEPISTNTTTPSNYTNP